MTADPRVSCVIPVWNGERYLSETLDSIFAQTWRPIDVIVVDDGSTDGTPAVIAAYGDRIRSVQQSNGGEASARNAGVRAAHGDLVAFLDADDLWEPLKLTRQVERLRADPAIDLCFTHYQNFWADDLAAERAELAEAPLAQPSAAWSIGTLVARREVFGRFGPFDEQLKQLPNMTWFLQAVRRGARVDVLPDVLMRRRLHAHNATRRAPALSREEFLPMLKTWRDLRRAGLR